MYYLIFLSLLVTTFANQLEYYYQRPHNECDFTSQVSDVVDEIGIGGTPYVTYITCPNTTIYGYNKESFRVYFFLENGFFESLWVEAGAFFNITMDEGYITGGRFSPYISPYTSSIHRHYTLENAIIAHDEHINEGDSETVDLLWSNIDFYQPPLVTVVSCMKDENDMLWVKDHFHPKGALYVALVGTQCFLVDGVNRCIQSQTEEPAIRWVSPLLRYNESFAPSNSTSPFVDYVLGYTCQHPLAFSVEQFDYLRNGTLPNFMDIPSTYEAITGELRTTILLGVF